MKPKIIVPAVLTFLSLTASRVCAASLEKERAESGKIFAEYAGAPAAVFAHSAGTGAAPAAGDSAPSAAFPYTSRAQKPALGAAVPPPAEKAGTGRSSDNMYWDSIAKYAVKPAIAAGIAAGAIGGAALLGAPGLVLGIIAGAVAVAAIVGYVIFSTVKNAYNHL